MKQLQDKLLRQGRWLIVFWLMMACVERIEFEVPAAQLLTVVEGYITDDDGPYVVELSKGLPLDADSSFRTPIRNASVYLFDDMGQSEKMLEKNPGAYVSGGLIKGAVGHEYHIRIETADGKVFESEPDLLNPVGDIEGITFEFEARKANKGFGEVAADVFNIFVDAKAPEKTESYVRWRFQGTYKVITHPDLHLTWNPPYTPYKDPFPCSGYRIALGPEGSGGILEQFAECECCTCWAKHYEPAPQLSDTQLVSNSQFSHVKVAEVPISNNTFHDKYLVEIEQMSLSRKAFEFFKLVRTQKEGASSLFQPPSGELRGNIQSSDPTTPVVGIFWATAIKRKSKYIYRTDLPYPVTPIDYITLPCYNAFENASSTKPANWE